jgi:hypothetical protein
MQIGFGETILRSIVAVGVIAALLGCVHAAQLRAETAPAQASESLADVQLVRLDLTATLKDGMPVTVDNPYGDVRLRFGGYEHVLEIHAVTQQPDAAAAIALEPAVDKDRYLIAPRLPAGTLLAEGQRLDLVVFVPLGHAPVVRTERGAIESRSIRADLDLQSTSGNIAVRGTRGRVLARTGAGTIEASLGPAPTGSEQVLATTTGNIIVAVTDDLNARLELATSAVFATEYSLQVKTQPGQEPNKSAVAVVGEDQATIRIQSRRGEIRLLRWIGFTSSDEAPDDTQGADDK